VDPAAYQRPFSVSAQGLDASFKVNGDFDTIELGLLTGTQLAERITGISNLPVSEDQDLCPVHFNLERDGKDIWISLRHPDSWEFDDHIVGVPEEFTTPQLARMLEQGMVALVQYGLRPETPAQAGPGESRASGDEARADATGLGLAMGMAQDDLQDDGDGGGNGGGDVD
jgi:hypothetical protein